MTTPAKRTQKSTNNQPEENTTTMAVRKNSTTPAVAETPAVPAKRAPKKAAPVTEAAPEQTAEQKPVLLLVADSSDGSRSTRKAPASFKTPGPIFAVEVTREKVPAWKVQSYHRTREQAEAVAAVSVEKFGATAARVIEARCVEAAS